MNKLVTSLVFCLVAWQATWAATFNVDSTVDAVDAAPGNGVCATAGALCTLRAAIQEANAFPGADVINVPTGFYLFALAGDEDSGVAGDLDVTSAVTITGAGAALTIIDAGALDRVFDIRPGATATLSGLTLQNGNSAGQIGGGIRSFAGLDLSGAIVTGNSSTSDGGGIHSEGALAALSLIDVTVSGNSGENGGGIWTKDLTTTPTFSNITVSGNSATKSGGGIYTEKNSLTLNDSTINGNDALDGGGWWNKGNAFVQSVSNATFSGNSASNKGGAIHTEAGNVTLTNVTITGNSASTGGGIETPSGNPNLTSTLVANSPGGGDCSGSLGTVLHSLDTDGSCGPANTGAPLLGPLQDNGGPTFTHALLAGSPAIDAVLAGCPPPGVDQRGVVRPQGANCDIGAFEVGTYSISGRIFEDIVGDGLADGPIASAPNPFEPGARIELWLDGGDGQPDGGDDGYQGFTISSGVDGSYSFAGRPPGIYWVTVDSGGVDSGPYNVGYSGQDRWAEQTYGPVGAARYDGVSLWTFAGSAGPFYGGAEWDVSDDFPPANSLATAEHIARVDLNSGTKIDVDFGFSFNVVTTTRGGTAAQDPGAGGGQRTVQGSLRQFLTNANAQSGANAMRFVPVAPTNDSGSGGNWWQLDIQDLLPAMTDAATTIDGTAYDAADGTTVRNDNTAVLGAGGTVGVDSLALPQLAGPEMEIVDIGGLVTGLDVQADGVTVRRLAIYGFGPALNTGNVRVGLDNTTNFTGVTIEDNVLGGLADSFSDPDLLLAGSGTDGASFAALGADFGTLQRNLIGFSGRNCAIITKAANDWTVEQNEFRGGGLDDARSDGLGLTDDVERTSVTGNLFVDNQGAGVDFFSSVGSHTLLNNTFDGNGQGGVETAGVRMFGADGLIDRNVFNNQFGSGVLAIVSDPAFPTANTPATRQRITRNRFGGNGSNAIDLQTTLDIIAPGDGITLNDGTLLGDSSVPNTCGTVATHGNQGLDTPIVDRVLLGGGGSTVRGRACPGAEVEIYRAVADGDASDTLSGTDYGEGLSYLATAIAAAGTGLFEATAVAGLSAGDHVSAIAIDSNDNTSEFSGNVLAQPLTIVKRAFQLDGTPITGGSTLPSGTPVRFLLYIDNPGVLVTDVSLRDVLDPLFLYVGGSARYDNSVASCAAPTCTAVEEAAIFAAADSGTVGTDPVDGDVLSYAASNLDLGNQSAANAQLDIAADKVWAVVFTVRVQ